MQDEDGLVGPRHIIKGRRHRFLAADLLLMVNARNSIAWPFVSNRIGACIAHAKLVQQLAFSLAILILVVAFINVAEAHLVLISAAGMILKTGKDAVNQLAELEYGKRPTVDLVSRITVDTSVLRAAYTNGVVECLRAIMIVIGYCGATTILSLPLTAVSVAVLVAALSVMVLLCRGIRETTARTQEALGIITNRSLRVLESARSVTATGAINSE